MLRASFIVRAALWTGSRTSGWRTEVWAGGSNCRVVIMLVDDWAAMEGREKGVPGDWNEGAGIPGLVVGV